MELVQRFSAFVRQWEFALRSNRQVIIRIRKQRLHGSENMESQEGQSLGQKCLKVFHKKQFNPYKHGKQMLK